MTMYVPDIYNRVVYVLIYAEEDYNAFAGMSDIY